MAATDARFIPHKATAYRLTFAILDANGQPVSGASGLDSEVSLDGGAFADCIDEATEIGSSGFYTLDLDATEMDADTVALIVKTSTSGARPHIAVLYPEEAGDLRVNITEWLGDTPNALVSGRVDGSVGALAANVVTASAIAADAIGAAELAPAPFPPRPSGPAPSRQRRSRRMPGRNLRMRCLTAQRAWRPT